MSLRDEYFLYVQGNTDSEWAFAVFLNELANLGCSPSQTKPGGFGHAKLRAAMMNTISQINKWCKEVGEQEPSLLNFAVTDGEAVVASRYVSSSTEEPASLFFRYTTPFCNGGFNWEVRGRRFISMRRDILEWRGEIRDRILCSWHQNH
jgi:glutamine amidotransferase